MGKRVWGKGGLLTRQRAKLAHRTKAWRSGSAWHERERRRETKREEEEAEGTGRARARPEDLRTCFVLLTTGR